jgi:hypothetical protein
VTATWAEEPFLFRRHLRPGMHITTLGPDQPGKCEIAAEALLALRRGGRSRACRRNGGCRRCWSDGRCYPYRTR